ncbi:MAG: carotenoid biosynthesis protein [Actinomycetes bacterium]
MRQVWGTVGHRWYVTIFGVVFVVCAVRQMGWKRTLAYAVAAVGLGVLAENGSVHFGVPYTQYHFDSALRHKEIFVGSVPLMVPLSYTFMAYFAFAGGRLLASGPWHTRARKLWHEYVLAVMLAVWVIWIVDPVSRLGNHFFLGQLFRYDGPGFWFGLPIGSQAGFALTAGVLIALLAYLTRHEPDRVVRRALRHPHLTALITYHGQLVMMTAVAVHIGAVTIGGAAVLIWVPAATITAVYWSAIRPPRGAADVASAAVPEQVSVAR